MTTKSEFEQVPFNVYLPQTDLERELDELRRERDAADRRLPELWRRMRNAEIRVEVLESLLDDQNSEIIRLRRLASRSWEERLREEIIASGMRVLKRLRRR
jgi:predicted  nucleic acid-binding Zn-ribbon protein